MNNEPDFDVTARLVSNLLNTDPPPEAQARMRRHLDQLRARLASPPFQFSDQRSTLRRRSVMLATLMSLAAAVLVMTIVLLPSGSSRALANLVAAISAKPWLHAQGTGPDHSPAEMWFSAKHGVVAYRLGKNLVFVDRRQGTLDVFGPLAASHVVERVSLKNAPAYGVEAANQSFLALLGGDLAGAMKKGGQRVLKHESKAIKENGRALIEHRFIVAHATDDIPSTESILRVDRDSKLPVSWQVVLGDNAVFDFQISYPDEGPRSIITLGAPANAAIVDSTPRGEFQQLLSATNAAWRNFDNYHAIVIESTSRERHNDGQLCYRLWRKGSRWRVDQCRIKLGSRAPNDVDPDLWWLRQVRKMKSFPREICDGTHLVSFTPANAIPQRPDPNDPQYLLIESLKTKVSDVADHGIPRSTEYVYEMPDNFGYPDLSRGASLGFHVETQPVDRDGKSLLRLDIVPTADLKPTTRGRQRFFFDSQQTNMAARAEYYEGPNAERLTGASEVISAARTPMGLSYPTTVRVIGGSVKEDNSRSDWYYRYYLEFRVDVPEKLFDVNSIDLSNFWTALP